MKNLIIIGAGPAGISAALYAKMSGTNVTVIGKDNSSLKTAEHIGNYYGFSGGISGSELFNNGIGQAKNLGVNYLDEEVLNIGFGEGFIVTTNNSELLATAIILASGKSRNKPKIANFNAFEGKGISYCAVCDGFFYRNKNIGIIGAGEYALHEYEYLKNIAASVTVFSDGAPVNPSFEKIAVTEKVASFYGQERFNGLQTASGAKYDLDGVFIAVGSADASSIAKSVGILTENGNIVIDENAQTNVPGIFAAGDCTGGLAQISKCIYQGMTAGMAASRFVKKST